MHPVIDKAHIRKCKPARPVIVPLCVHEWAAKSSVAALRQVHFGCWCFGEKLWKFIEVVVIENRLPGRLFCITEIESVGSFAEGIAKVLAVVDKFLLTTRVQKKGLRNAYTRTVDE